MPLYAFADDSIESSQSSSTSSQSDTESTQSVRKVNLGKSIVRDVGEVEAYQSGETINRQMIENSPSGNGDITSILRILPNVQYDNAQLKSNAPGEIDPANISISGGLYYQNNFQLDGFNMNNDLNPTKGGDWLGAAPGRSQGLAIDTSLLESITVQDSNVSAAYGGFTGGVVEANTRRPTKSFGANVSYQITQGNVYPGHFSMTNYHIYGDSSDLQDFYDSVTQGYSENNSPEFIKHLVRASIESKINDRSGIIASFTTTQSFMPIRYNSTLSSSQVSPIDPGDLTTRKQTQKRQIYNFFIKGYYDPSDSVRLELSYTYAPQYDYRFMSGTLGDFYSFDSGGHQVGLKTTWENALGTLTNNLGYSFLENSTVLHGFEHTKYWIPSSTKNWGRFSAFVREGGYAPSESTQHTLSNKLIQDFIPFQDPAGITHRFQAGLELGYQYADFAYSQDYFFARNNGNQHYMTQAQQALCAQTNSEWCDSAAAYYTSNIGSSNVNYGGLTDGSIDSANWNSTTNTGYRIFTYGQYFGHVELYRKSKVDVNNTLISAFLEDDMQIPLEYIGNSIGYLNIRPGLRIDSDTYMGKVTFAPRLSMNYEAPWNESDRGRIFATRFTAGVNRYYGRNLFHYMLHSKMNSMAVGIARDNPNVDWYDVLADGIECIGTNANNSGSQNCITTYKDSTKFSQLKIPYADELMIGVAQNVYDVNIGAKYIKRIGRDEIRPITRSTSGLPEDSNYTTNYTVYTNEGYSNSDIVTLVVENHQPLNMNIDFVFNAGSEHHSYFQIKNFFMFAFDWTNVKRNYNDDTVNMTSIEYQNELILENGKVIHSRDRTASNYVRPYTLRLNTTHTFNLGRTKWLLNNFFRFRSAYEAMTTIHTAGTQYNNCNQATGRGCPNAKYDPNHNDKTQLATQRIKETFTWDLRLGFEVNVYKGNTMYMNLDIYNVFDKKNPTILTRNYTGSSSLPTLAYEVGRQFWVQVGYKY